MINTGAALTCRRGTIARTRTMYSCTLSRGFKLGDGGVFLNVSINNDADSVLLLTGSSSGKGGTALCERDSIHLTTKMFFGTIVGSSAFERTLLSFRRKRGAGICISGVGRVLARPSGTPCFLGDVFSRLGAARSCRRFCYSVSMGTGFMFAVPTCMANVLLCCSKVLVNGAVGTRRLRHISEISMLSFNGNKELFR